jgi:hypothetical protein
MAALDMTHLHLLAKRKKSWPAKNAGVMLVFCIVFVIATGLISLAVYRKILARRAAKARLPG